VEVWQQGDALYCSPSTIEVPALSLVYMAAIADMTALESAVNAAHEYDVKDVEGTSGSEGHGVDEGTSEVRASLHTHRYSLKFSDDLDKHDTMSLLFRVRNLCRQYMSTRSETAVAQAESLVGAAINAQSVKSNAKFASPVKHTKHMSHLSKPQEPPVQNAMAMEPVSIENTDDEDFALAYFELGLAYLCLALDDHKLQFLPDAIRTYEASLSHFNRILQLTGEDRANRPRVLNNLANAYQAQYDRQKDNRDDVATLDLSGLQQGTIYAREALALRPRGHPRRLESLMVLRQMLDRLYEVRSNQNVLDETLGCRREALELVPQNSETRSALMSDLAAFILDIEEPLLTVELAQEAVELMRTILDITSSETSLLGDMNNLASALNTLYSVSRDIAAVDEAITIYEEILKALPQDDSFYRHILDNIANSYYRRWAQTNDIASLEASMKRRKEAQAYTNHKPDLRRIYHSLGVMHSRRYHMLYAIEDMEEGLSYLRKALHIRDDPKGRIETLYELAILLKKHYASTHSPGSLSSCISFSREVLQARPPSHPTFFSVSILLAEALLIDAKKNGNHNSRKDAIEICVGATAHIQGTSVEATSTEQAKSLLLLLSSGLVEEYVFTKHLETLNKAVNTLEQMLNTSYGEDPDVLRDLISALRLRAQETDDPVDADAIRRFSVLLRKGWKDATTDSGDGKSPYAISLLYHQGHESLDAGERHAVVLSGKECLNRTPPGHPLHYLGCVQYAVLLLDRLLGHFDFLEAMRLIVQAADVPIDSQREAFEIITEMFQVFDARIEEALTQDEKDTGGHIWREAALEAYIATIRLLPKIAYFGLDQRDQLAATQQGRFLAIAAASHALALGKANLSLEILEQGRAIFWSQAVRLRTRDSDFGDVPSNIATELKGIFSELDALNNSEEEYIMQVTRGAWARDNVFKARRRSARAQQLIEEVRTQPGLERFLMGPSYETMSQLASSTHIIVVLVAHCNGLAQQPMAEAIVLISPHQDPVRVGLPDVTPQRLTDMAQELRKSNETYRSGAQAEMEASRGLKIARTAAPKETADVLMKLWTAIVKPIIDAFRWKVRYTSSSPFLLV
jgi:tetratricopeptide (TPR) repeat protein